MNHFKLLTMTLALSLLVFTLHTNASTPSSAPTAAPTAKTLKAQDGKVEFVANGLPSFVKIRGTGAVPTGEMKVADGKAAGEFKIDLTKFTTEMDRRDKHMRETLQVEQFPIATIRFKDIPFDGTNQTMEVPAELELHGEKQPIKLQTEFKDGKATGNFEIRLTEYKIPPPSMAGIKVDDKVKITIESTLKE